jgi:Pyruvate/2-oxoacid:ferredoxin oxidoreductase gamma subunit
MSSIRFHDRDGQDMATAAELLAAAAFSEGKHAQAFPSFGSERMGAPRKDRPGTKQPGGRSCTTTRSRP